ncbi:MAG: hypothetical protein Q4P23_01655 [Micrococcaceae bacterium]|nr:hypothetical protein [Micrococcaceae bacterium]
MILLTQSSGSGVTGIVTLFALVLGALGGTLIRVLAQRLVPVKHGREGVWIMEAAIAFLLGVIAGVLVPFGSESVEAALRAGVTTYCATSAYLCMVAHRREPGHGLAPAAGHFLLCLASSMLGIFAALALRPVFE